MGRGGSMMERGEGVDQNIIKLANFSPPEGAPTSIIPGPREEQKSSSDCVIQTYEPLKTFSYYLRGN